MEHQRFRYVKVVSNHKRLPASNPAVCSKTWRDVSERQRNTSVLCSAFFALRWKTKFVFARVGQRGTGGRCKNTAAVQDKPSLPRSDIYSGPGAWECARGLPRECVLRHGAPDEVSPPPGRKAPLMRAAASAAEYHRGSGRGEKKEKKNSGVFPFQGRVFASGPC